MNLTDSVNLKKIHSLFIVEVPYGDLNWGPDPAHQRPGIYSDVQHWKKYRELDDYHLCGVYAKAGVPYRVEEIVYAPRNGENPAASRHSAISTPRITAMSIPPRMPVCVTAGVDISLWASR